LLDKGRGVNKLSDHIVSLIRDTGNQEHKDIGEIKFIACLYAT